MKPKSTLSSFFCIASSALLTISYVHAADGTWNGITGNWSDTTDPGGVWSLGAPADGFDSTANFTGIDIAADQIITLDIGRTIGNIIFTDVTTSSNNLAITGNTLTLDLTSGVPIIDVTQADRTLTIDSVVAGTDGLQKNGTGNLTLTGANTFTGDTTVSGGTLQIGSGGATGSLYSPTVSVTGNLTFGSASSIVNNGTLVYNMVGGSVNVNRTISGSGTVSVTGNQRVNFAAGTTINTTGSQTYSATNTSVTPGTNRYFGYTLADNATVALTSPAGSISMTGMLGTANGNTGNLAIDTSGGNGNVTLNVAVGVSNVNFGLNSLNVNAGTGTISLGKFNNLNWGQANTISLTGGAINSTVNMTGFTTQTVTNSSASLFSGALSGGGAFTKAGGGTLTSSAQNSFGGVLTINSGTLEFSNAGSVNGGAYNVYGSTQININNGATLRVSGASSGANIEIFNGRNYNFDSNGGGSFLLGAGNYNANTAGFSVTTNGGARNNIGLISTSGAFGMNLGTRVGTFNVALGSDATSDLTVTPIINNGGSIVKNGAGRLTLIGANTYNGATTINNGTLALSGAANSNSTSGIAIANSANLTFAATDQRSFTKAITGTAGDVTFNVAGNTTNSGGANGINFAFSNTGAAFTGNIVINTGLVAPSSDAAFGDAANIIKLSAASGASSGLVATANRNLNRSIELVTAGGNGIFRAYDATTLTLGGVVSGPGNLVKTDSGTVILTNTNNYSGDTTVGFGTLTLNNVNANNETSTVTIAASNAKLQLGFAATDTVEKLFIGSTQQVVGEYGHTNSGATNGGAGVGAMNAYFAAGTGKLNVTAGPPTGGYAAWKTANFTAQTIDLDHDSDGVPNGVEFFLGGTTNTTGFTPVPGVIDTAGVLSVTWTKAATYTGTYGTDFVVETSATLASGSWVNETATPTPGFTVTFPTANEVKYTFPTGTTNFARLKVTGP